MAERILIVDDDRSIVRMLQRTLQAGGYETATAGDGGQALVEAERFLPDAVILDVGMPGLDGLSVTEQLRGKGNAVPILILSARGELGDRVAGLWAGADDYLSKPFAVEELMARLRALLRRHDHGRMLAYGDLTLDVETGAAVRGSRSLTLTRREADMLALLLRRAGRVVSRDAALQAVWGERPAVANSVDRYVSYLRAKLGEPQLIHTVRGVGFVLRGE